MNNIDDISTKNNRWGIATSIAIHLILLLLFLWVNAWKEPYPPNPEYGIELNFGITENGSGNEPVSSEQTVDETEEVETPDTEEALESSESQEATEQNIESSEEVEESVQDTPLQEDGIVEETKENTTKKTEQQKEVQEKSTESKDPVKESEPEKPKPNPNALFPGNNKSQGDNKVGGDQGVKDGDVKAEALMGSQGGGNGSKLEMAGWAWESPPNRKDDSNQTGKIIFQIRINNNGEVEFVETLETTVSPDVVRFYKNEVQRLSFYKTSAGTTLDSYSGKVIFIISSK